ncbi:hypothetical protein GCM10023144_43700 [Pigmentiphaga soli]|uniref:DUF3540 domain-containing protein n=1 Tax=Pigmentiphaga soli TaxID=1007095 RepID=A0ABP8HP46_9BURK
MNVLATRHAAPAERPHLHAADGPSPAVPDPGAAAPAADCSVPAHACATVCLAADAHYILAIGTLRLRAVRAAGCLLMPEAGDTVAWWRGDGDGGYILSVLARANAGPQRLLLDGDAEIEARGGALTLQSAQAVTLRGARLAVDADELHVRAGKALGVFDALETFGRSVVSTISEWKIFGTELSSVFDRVSQYARSSHRVTDGIDHVSASTLDLRGKQMLNLQGENVMAGGSRLVKVQGKQIHLG